MGEQTPNPIKRLGLHRHLFLIGEWWLTFELARTALDQNREVVLAIISADVPEIIAEVLPTAEGQQQAVHLLMSENRNRVQHYLDRLLNQSVVAMCSVLEVFLDEALESIFEFRPETLLTFASEKQVDIKEIVAATNKEALLGKIRRKQVEEFSRLPIGTKFARLGTLGLKQPMLFNWDVYTVEFQQILKGYDLNKLVALFEQRHAVVHRGELPFKIPEDVKVIEEFFQKLMLNLAETVWRVFGLTDDMGIYAARQLRDSRSSK